MIGRGFRPAGVRSRRRPVALIALGALAMAACGGSDDERGAPVAQAAPTSSAPATTPVASSRPTPSTTASTTTGLARPTTTRASTTTLPATTTSTTTDPIVVTLPETTLTAEPLDEPVPPPADVHASEPIIEIGSIAIPKLDVDMTMYEGVRLSTLEYGPGHWPGTAMPGQQGNVVVGGHRTSSHRVFRHVDQLVPGDEIIFRDAGQEHVYHVDRVEIVDPTAVWIVDPTETPTATLFACHPPGSTAQRIVVFADLATT